MKRLFLLCLCLPIACAARAQLTLDSCRLLARAHYPEIRQYDLIGHSEAYTLSNARRAWLPQLALGAQATWQTETPEFPDEMNGFLAQAGIDIPGMRRDQYRIGIELEQTLWDGGGTAAEKRLAEAEATERRRSVDVDFHALEGRVDELFFGILLLEERLRQTEFTLDLLRNDLDRVQALHRNGVAQQSDIDAVEVELLTAGQQLGQLEATCGSYRRMLERFIGRPLGKNETLVRPELDMPLTTVNARPELALFEAQEATLAAQELRIRSAARPRFGLFAQGYYGYPGLDYFQSMMHADWSWNALVGIRMSWNFGAYYTRRNSLGNLRVARRGIDVQRDLFLFDTDLHKDEQMGEIERLRRALADDDRIVELRCSVRKAAESGLRNGVLDTHELLRRITEEATARSARSAREIELLKAIYSYRHTLNQ